MADIALYKSILLDLQSDIAQMVTFPNVSYYAHFWVELLVIQEYEILAAKAQILSRLSTTYLSEKGVQLLWN